MNLKKNNPSVRRIANIGYDNAFNLGGRILLGVGGGLSAWSGYQNAVDNGDSTGEAIGVGLTEGVADIGISWGMAAGGAEAGAMIGTLVGGPAGTVIGAGIRAVIGAGAAIFASASMNTAISGGFSLVKNWFS